MAEHAKATHRYRAVSAAAAMTRAGPDLEDKAEDALRELSEIETLALTLPAADATSLRFKLALWADGRVDGFEEEWRVFTADCERLLLEAGKERRSA